MYTGGNHHQCTNYLNFSSWIFKILSLSCVDNEKVLYNP